MGKINQRTTVNGKLKVVLNVFSFFLSSFPLYLFIYLFLFYTFVCTRFFFFQFSLKYSVYFACTYFLCNIILYPDSVCYL